MLTALDSADTGVARRLAAGDTRALDGVATVPLAHPTSEAADRITTAAQRMFDLQIWVGEPNTRTAGRSRPSNVHGLLSRVGCTRPSS